MRPSANIVKLRGFTLALRLNRTVGCLNDEAGVARVSEARLEIISWLAIDRNASIIKLESAEFGIIPQER
jgi:hypothetical protein